MDDKDKKLIFDYCGWKMACRGNSPEICFEDNGSLCIKCEFYHPLNGNDILEAVRIMEEKGDWLNFTSSVELRCYQYIKLTPSEFPYLLQNFFEFMAAWLKERKQCKS